MKIALLENLLVSDKVIDRLFAPLKAAGHELVINYITGKSDEEKIAAAEGAEIIIIANGPLSENVINNLPDLKMISVAFTGVDHLPMALCNEKGITVCNSQGYASQAVVELVFGLLFNVYRKIIPADKATRAGEGSGAYFGTELCGKTFGLVGAGAIGSEVARIAQAFGCEVIAYDPFPQPKLEKLGISMVSFDEVIKTSDVITVHTPLLDSTRGLIGAQQFADMKPGVVFLNCARGPVVDNEALTEALLSGKLAGAGIDVYDVEPPLPADYCLLKVKENVVFTPHTAFGTTESFIKRADIVFNNMIQYLAGTPQNLKTK